MADSTFKNNPFKLPKGSKVHTTGQEIGKHKYKPDVSIKDSNEQFSYVFESTSTNDRKVGLGELLLAEKLFVDENRKGVLVFSLCGKSSSPPRPETQIEYIRPYFNFLKQNNKDKGVGTIHFIYEECFKKAGWDVLSKQFKDSSHTLCV